MEPGHLVTHEGQAPLFCSSHSGPTPSFSQRLSRSASLSSPSTSPYKTTADLDPPLPSSLVQVTYHRTGVLFFPAHPFTTEHAPLTIPRRRWLQTRHGRGYSNDIWPTLDAASSVGAPWFSTPGSSRSSAHSHVNVPPGRDLGDSGLRRPNPTGTDEDGGASRAGCVEDLHG